MRIVPLLLVEDAMRVDPGQPRHAVHALRLHQELGEAAEARCAESETAGSGVLRTRTVINPMIAHSPMTTTPEPPSR